MYKKQRVAYSVIIILTLIFCAAHGWADELHFETSENTAKKSAKMVKAEMIIEIKNGIIDLGGEHGIVPQEKVRVGAGLLAELNKKYGLLSVERLFSGTRKETPSDIYVFRFPPKANMSEIISKYKEDGSVIYAEQNYGVSAK